MINARDNRVSLVPHVAIYPQIGSVAVPHWLLAIALVSLAFAAPRIGHRFSLRALLIATAIIAVTLGLIRWME